MSQTKKGLVLVVDDDPSLRRLVSHWLEHDGYEVEQATDGEEALGVISHVSPDVMLLDVEMPGPGGVETLTRLRQREPLLPVIMLTGETGVETIVATMQLGAYDYLTKPPEKRRLITTVERACEHGQLSVRLRVLEREASGSGYERLIGQSEPMRELYRELDRVTAADITVLVRGESGTGKELVAQSIHEASGRAGGPFVAINCAAIPENLQESELFGHEKGAFTGAASQRKGRFEQADGGTLFLDELGELSAAAQARLLRALQERKFFRVGGNREIHSDFRLVAATNRDLESDIREGRFREDLFYRIAVYEIVLPPLRDRRGDVVRIAERMIDGFAKENGFVDCVLGQDAIAALDAHSWPGNVRELQNTVQRAVVASGGGAIAAEHLPQAVRATAPAVSSSLPAAAAGGHIPEVTAIPESGPFPTIAEMEERLVRAAIDRSGGNLSEAGRLLGISRTTLYRKLSKYGLDS